MSFLLAGTYCTNTINVVKYNLFDIEMLIKTKHLSCLKALLCVSKELLLLFDEKLLQCVISVRVEFQVKNTFKLRIVNAFYET